MKRSCVFAFTIVLITVIISNSAFAALSVPYDTAPIDSDSGGPSARRDSGGFLPNVNEGYTELVYWIGTGSTPGFLVLDFANPFTDGAGNDFAILTGDESWGDLADQAEFSFYYEGSLRDSFNASLAPSTLFEFDLPGTGLVANRIVITNITPDPPGVNNLSTMEFLDAGIAYPTTHSEAPNIIPVPAAMILSSIGAGFVGWLRRRGTL